jgi:glutathione synthase
MADLLAAASLGNQAAGTAATDPSVHDGVVLGLSREQLDDAKEQAISWAAAHGMLVRWKAAGPNAAQLATFTHIPFCLFPVQIPRAQFEHGVALSPVYGRLMDRVSRDLPWLHKTLETVVHEDKFTARLLALSKQIEAEGIQQKAYLGIHRSDYMLHEPQAETPGDTQRLLQVELNTISSSFGCISSLTSQLHSYLIERLAHELPALESHYGVPLSELASRVPANHAINELPNAIATAHKHYGVHEYVIWILSLSTLSEELLIRWCLVRL